MLGFVPIPRLHMIYLGLSLMGVGALTHGLFCPYVIKRYPSAEAWLQGEDRMLSGGRLRGEFGALIQTYWVNTIAEPDYDEARENYYRSRKPGYSQERHDQIHLLMHEIVEMDDPAVFVEPELSPPTILGPDGQPAVRERSWDEGDEKARLPFERFYAGVRGHIHTDAWIDVLWHARSIERMLWEPLYATAVASFKERTVHIRFQDLARDHRRARGFVTVIYGLGIFALAIPTLHTFVAIIESAFR